MKNILVFGATSAICHELLKLYASTGANFFLLARNDAKLAAVSQDLVARGGKVAGQSCFDFSLLGKLEVAVVHAKAELGHVDLILVAHGTLPDPEKCEASMATVKTCMEDNFTSTAVIIQAAAGLFAIQGKGTLAVFSSVAGDRGRKSNYVYGAAKSGIDTLLQGLQGRFFGTDIRVVNIKPGMIDTPMTQGMETGALWSTPRAIAPTIHRAIAKGRRVCYVPGYWRLIMLVVRCLPTSILARLPI
jgi:decaprenylphospho-beta-D-erythro-pentofuranosid-2-ulose 2-reductase